MPDITRDISGVRVLLCDPSGPPLTGEADANDFVSAAWEHGAGLVAIPVSRLSEAFLDLSTGRAGLAVQKFVNYQLQLAILGDISARMASSRALRDFVRESNSRSQLWFLRDLAELEARLTGERPA